MYKTLKKKEHCYHCGDECRTLQISDKEKYFCCYGCKTVFDILQDNNLSYYYDLEKNPGTTPSKFEKKFDFLNNPTIVDKLLDFSEDSIQIVSLVIPSIHCSSCIWVLENLNKLNQNIYSAQVNFPKKSVRINFNAKKTSLKEIIILLCKIGYDPSISLEDFNKKKEKKDHSLIYKLGISGFAFGNIMFLSLPEYFEVNEFWLNQFKYTFRWLMLIFSLPVVFYASADYFISAYKSLRSSLLNIDVPIALGVLVLFVRSAIDVVMNFGSGFFDSLTGLIFFLLLGKYFQQKTYNFLSFERDYKSYFPIAVTQITFSSDSKHAQEKQIPVYEIQKDDHILIRNNELIPVDAILIKGNACIDYSFVTGEVDPIFKNPGEKLFAGGKQTFGIIELQVLNPVNQSYLTRLWSNKIFDKNNNQKPTFQTLTDTISKYFTPTILFIACFAAIFWMIYLPSKSLNVFTAILIVACPCALALSTPFTMGNLIRIFGKHNLYIKNSTIIEQMAKINTFVFDKTGTLTTSKKNKITFKGEALTENEYVLLASTLKPSNHMLSRTLYRDLKIYKTYPLEAFEEITGEGIKGIVKNQKVKIGSYAFVNNTPTTFKSTTQKTTVHISINSEYKGYYIFNHQYRRGIKKVFNHFNKESEIIVLSGDNEGEKIYLQKLLPKATKFLFNQTPEEKLKYIKNLQQKGKKVMMIGDGLNDSGALAQSDVGISISENINVFSPACDGILDAKKFKDLYTFFTLSKKSIKIIKLSFVFSLFYNLIGLSFAITGHLTPILAAILMPLSSISIVAFTTLSTYILGLKLK